MVELLLCIYFIVGNIDFFVSTFSSELAWRLKPSVVFGHNHVTKLQLMNHLR